jgi:hypothetical protein
MIDPLDVNDAASSVPAARALMMDHIKAVGYACPGRGYQKTGKLLANLQEKQGRWFGSTGCKDN